MLQYGQTQHDLDTGTYRYEWRVLLAENNVTNQIVTEGMLELFGCKVDLIVNGRDACQAVTRQKYDLILMDCQMPELDGYSATEKIREYKQQTEGSRTPIVALTAHAMDGDRERCIEAGMDAYLCKLLHPHQLQAVLERWLAGSTQQTTKTMGEEGDDVSEVLPSETVHFDPDVLKIYRKLESEGQPGLFSTLIKGYFTDVQVLLDTISRAIREHDSESLWNAAHTMKTNNSMMGQ